MRNLTLTTIAIVAATVYGMTLASAQSTAPAPRAPNVFSLLTKEQCTSDKGAVWKDSETWTRQSDGKVRVSRARCAFDAKSAKAILSARLIAR